MTSTPKASTKPVTKLVKPTAKAVATSSVDPMAKDGAAARSPKVPNATEPSLRFHHSIELRSKTVALLAALEETPNPHVHGPAMADLVAELTEAGMDYYFMKALKQAKVGFVGEQSARLGISGAVKLISSVSRKFIERMDTAQLLVVAQHIRGLS